MIWWVERVEQPKSQRELKVGERVRLKLTMRRKAGFEHQDVWVTVTDIGPQGFAYRGALDSKHPVIKRESIDFLMFHVAEQRLPMVSPHPVQQTLW